MLRRRLAPALLLCLLVPLLVLVGGTSTASATPASSQSAPAADRSHSAADRQVRTPAQKKAAAKKKAAKKAAAKKKAAKKKAAKKRAKARAAAAAKAKEKAAKKKAAEDASKPAHLPVPPLVGGVEDYARYEPQATCSPEAKPGAVVGLRWAVATYGGRAGGISRACGGSVSEHKEGRAFDWTLDAAKAGDRAIADRYLKALFATGPSGQPAELARRMGVMYVIWNDKMYSSYRQFAAKPYVSSSCRDKPLKDCSKTLRHRDHVHVSLSWAGGKAQTSWYATAAARKLR